MSTESLVHKSCRSLFKIFFLNTILFFSVQVAEQANFKANIAFSMSPLQHWGRYDRTNTWWSPIYWNQVSKWAGRKANGCKKFILVETRFENGHVRYINILRFFQDKLLFRCRFLWKWGDCCKPVKWWGEGEKSYLRSISFLTWESTNNRSLEICKNRNAMNTQKYRN